MTTLEIVQEFSTLISSTEQDYTLQEMKKMLAEVYKAKTTGKKMVVKKVVAKKVVDKKDDDNDETDEEDKPKKRGRPAKVRLDKEGNIKEKKAPSAYNKYVKSVYSGLKEKNPDAKAPEIMKLAAAMWKTAEENPKKEGAAETVADISENDNDE